MKELEKAVPMQVEKIDGVEFYSIDFIAEERLLEPACLADKIVRIQMRHEKENES